MKLSSKSLTIFFSLTLLIQSQTGFTFGKRTPKDITLVQSSVAETTLGEADLPDAKDVWIKMIREAKSTIDMGQFYLANAKDSALESVIQELEKAGTKGIKIRVIVDTVMIQNDPATYDRFKKIPGLEMRIYNLKALTGGIIHAKYFVIDKETLFIGSQNFDWRAITHIHETGVLVKDKRTAAQLTEVFDIDWKICETGKLPTPAVASPFAPSTVELVASPAEINPKDVRSSLVALIELLKSAKKSIRFMVMDYNTSSKTGRFGAIDDELRAAHQRGVKVEMMVSDWSTSSQSAVDQLKDLAKAGVNIKIVVIPQSSQGCIPYSRTMHSKMMMVDDATIWVGTSNWSQGYFTATRGVEMIFKIAAITSQGNKIFNTLWTSPYAALVDQDKTYIPPNKDCATKP